MMSILKKLAKKVPAVRDHLASVKTLVMDNEQLHGDNEKLHDHNEQLHRDIGKLQEEIGALRELLAYEVPGPEDWSKLKKLKLDMVSHERAIAATDTLNLKINPLEGHHGVF
jgi:hypothetical protein